MCRCCWQSLRASGWQPPSVSAAWRFCQHVRPSLAHQFLSLPFPPLPPFPPAATQPTGQLRDILSVALDQAGGDVSKASALIGNSRRLSAVISTNGMQNSHLATALALSQAMAAEGGTEGSVTSQMGGRLTSVTPHNYDTGGEWVDVGAAMLIVGVAMAGVIARANTRRTRQVYHELH